MTIDETINTASGAGSQGPANTDSSSATAPFLQNGHFISTIERVLPLPSEAADAEKKTAKGGANNSTEPEENGDVADQDGKKTKNDEDRFDKHPRFKELHSRAREAEARLLEAERKLQELNEKFSASAASAAPAGPSDNPGFKDISKMTKAEVLDWQAEDPVGFAANQAKQMAWELEKKVLGEVEKRLASKERETEEQRAVKTYQAFMDENPDFEDKYRSGELKRFMADNPGHNELSAYLMMTQQDREKKVAEAAKKAAIQEVKQKSGAAVLGQGTRSPASVTTTQLTDDLKNPKKYGGITAVLARRHMARQGLGQ